MARRSVQAGYRGDRRSAQLPWAPDSQRADPAARGAPAPRPTLAVPGSLESVGGARTMKWFRCRNPFGRASKRWWTGTGALSLLLVGISAEPATDPCHLTAE